MQGLVRALDMRLLRREGKLQEEEGMAAMTDNANGHTCETCDYCVYLGEGDFSCDERDYEHVIEDWVPLRLPCEKWTEE